VSKGITEGADNDKKKRRREIKRAFGIYSSKCPDQSWNKKSPPPRQSTIEHKLFTTEMHLEG